tara:strand:+ start:34 stop:612 length:579 start_codon:yes stop_codon:yes gene_type:complete
MFTADQFTRILNPVAGPYSSHLATEEDLEWLEELFEGSILYTNARAAILPHPTLEEINALGSPDATDLIFSRIYSKEGQRIIWELITNSCNEGIGTGITTTSGIGIHPDFRDQGHLPIFAKERFKAAKAEKEGDLYEWHGLFSQYHEVIAPAFVSPQVPNWDSAPDFNVALSRGKASYFMNFDDVCQAVEED